MWRQLTATALTALVCLFGLTATVDAKPGKPAKPKVVREFDRKPTDHPKLDRRLNDRADRGAAAKSRVIVTLNPGYDLGDLVEQLGGKRGRKFNIIGGQLIELPNNVLRKLADHKAVKSMHHDRKTGGEMNRAAIVEGARAVQQAYGYNGAGIGVAVVDSGITGFHPDLTYLGTNSAVRAVEGQRVTAFVDFVNGQTAKYDDNGHGSHVAGIVAGNGLLTLGARAGMAPAAHLVSLKVLDGQGGGYISNVIAALDWIVANGAAHNIRVVNLSVGAAVTESYTTDPLTLAAKRVVDQGIVVVTAAGNLGKHPTSGKTMYGGITAPGNAPWVLTVGAYSHNGSLSRLDDKMGSYSSRGPTARDFLAKPDVVATGTGIVSLAVPGSTLYTTKAQYLLGGSLFSSNRPYLSLTGTSMASPVVAGAVALMLQANPNLTPNLVKAIIQYTAQDYGHDPLTQGAGFLNAKGAVDLARFFNNPQAGQLYPHSAAWSKTILWGNRKVKRGVIKPAGSAYALNVVWGATSDAEGDNIVWGTACDPALDPECDNIVWGTSLMDGNDLGTFDAEGDNIVWGTSCDPALDPECDNIVWGTACDPALDSECDNIVWGTECGGLDCDNIVWGTTFVGTEIDNIVWGTADGCDPALDPECDNIVWGTSWMSDGEIDNIVWGSSSEADNITWGCAGAETPVFDDPDVPSEFDGSLETFESLFSSPTTATTTAEPTTTDTSTATTTAEPTTTVTSTTTTTTEPTTTDTSTITADTSTTTVIGGGL